MLSKDNFYGRALYLTKDTLFRVPARTLDVSGRTQVKLPTFDTLHPGGPIFYLINTTGSAIPIKTAAGVLVKNLPANSIGTVLLGTTKWVMYTQTYGSAKTWHSPGGRTIPVGQITTLADLVTPTSYDPISCTGGYRRARSCDGGAKAGIWMIADDVAPHFLASVASFSYNGQCFYFNESDRLLVGHGTLIDAADVTWYDTCADCTASLLCDSTNPNWPSALIVHIQDNFLGEFTGNHTVPFDGGGYFTWLKSPTFYFIHVECDALGWTAIFGYDLTGSPGGATVYSWSRFRYGTPAILPSIGAYTFLDGSIGGAACGGLGCWNSSTFEVLGYA